MELSFGQGLRDRYEQGLTHDRHHHQVEVAGDRPVGECRMEGDLLRPQDLPQDNLLAGRVVMVVVATMAQ